MRILKHNGVTARIPEVIVSNIVKRFDPETKKHNNSWHGSYYGNEVDCFCDYDCDSCPFFEFKSEEEEGCFVLLEEALGEEVFNLVNIDIDAVSWKPSDDEKVSPKLQEFMGRLRNLPEEQEN